MIKEIEIENFKSINNIKITIPRFSALVGKNASGKSNFISSISLLKKLSNRDNLATALNSIAPFPRELFFRNGEGSISHFIFKFEIPSNKTEYKLDFEIYNSPHEASSRNRVIFRKEKFQKKVRDGVYKNFYEREENSYKVQGNTINQKIRPSELLLASYPDKEVVEISDFLKTIAYVPESSTDGFPGINIIKEGNFNLNRIDDLAVSLFIKNESDFNRAFKYLEALVPSLITPSVVDLDSITEKGDTTEPSNDEEAVSHYIVRWAQKGIKGTVTRHSISGGDLRAIQLVLNMFNVKKGGLMLVEELENGMHLNRISKLIDIIKTISFNRNLQVLFTTHSTQILDHVLPKEVIYCFMDKDEGSKYKILARTKEYGIIASDLEKETGISASKAFESGLYE